MFSKQVIVSPNIGLMVNHSAIIFRTANDYKSTITLEYSDNVNGRTGSVSPTSLLGILSIGLRAGLVVKITAEGEDEKEAVLAIAKLLSPYG